MQAQELNSSEPVETIVDKHKAWLQEVSKQREALTKAAADQVRKAEEKRRRLQESQKVFRELVRMNEGGVLGDSVPTEMLTLPPLAMASPKPPVATFPTSVLRSGAASATGTASRSAAVPGGSATTAPMPAASAASSISKDGGKDAAALAAAARRKPAWARSEAAQDAVEDEDADRLLDFASGLDYERCVVALTCRPYSVAFTTNPVRMTTDTFCVYLSESSS